MNAMKHGRFLRVAAPLIGIAIAFGCGGGGGGTAGGGGGGGGTTLSGPIKITAKTPTGFAVPTNQLTLSGGLFAPAPLDAAGSATVNLFSAGRHLVGVLDSAGDPVLMGLVGAGKTQIDARSTVAAMVYLHVGGYIASPDNQNMLMEAIESDSRIDALVTEFETALKANPKALVDQTAAYRTSMSALARMMLSRSKGPREMAALIDPYPGEKSGIQVQYGSDKNQITAKNRYRRRALMFIDQIATVDNAGVETPAFKQVGTVEIKPALGTVYATDLLGNLTGLSTETTSDPVTVSDPTGGVDKIKLKAAVVGPGASAGDTYALTPTQQTAYRQLLKKSFYADFLLGILNRVLCNSTLEGLSPQQRATMYSLMQQTIEDQSATIIPWVESTFPGVETMMIEGDMKGALYEAISGIWKDTAAQNRVAQFYVEFFKKVPDFPFKPETGNVGKVLAWLNKAIKMETVRSVIGSAIGDLPQGRDWRQSKRTELWNIETNKVSVTLTPRSSKVDARGTNTFVKLTAKATNLTGVQPSAISYRFTTPGRHGTLRNSHANDVVSVEGTDDYVNYSSKVGLAASYGSDDVTVEVLVDRGGGQKEKVGTAKATVEVVAKSDIELLPRTQSVKKNQASKTIIAKTNYPNLLSDGKLKLRWKLEKGLGTLSVQPGQLTSTTNVTFTAGGTEGTETVLCEIVDVASGETMSTASATVKIEARTSIVFGSIRFYGHFSRANGWYESGWGIGFTVPKVQGAKSYSIRCYNFNDTAYYGTSIFRSCDANGNGADFDVDGNDKQLTTKGADGDFDFGLTGGAGWGPDGGGEAPDMRAYAYESAWRFSGMIVEVTVTY